MIVTMKNTFTLIYVRSLACLLSSKNTETINHHATLCDQRSKLYVALPEAIRLVLSKVFKISLLHQIFKERMPLSTHR